MESEFSTRSSKLHVWKIGRSFLQMVLNCEEWWKGLYTTKKHSMANSWMCGSLLWAIIQVNQLLIG